MTLSFSPSVLDCPRSAGVVFWYAVQVEFFQSILCESVSGNLGY